MRLCITVAGQPRVQLAQDTHDLLVALSIRSVTVRAHSDVPSLTLPLTLGSSGGAAAPKVSGTCREELCGLASGRGLGAACSVLCGKCYMDI